jgi:hypothetical protein
VARLTFPGEVGQNLGIDLSAVTLPSGGSLTVRRPDGGVVASGGFSSPNGRGIRIPTLTQSGTYTVEVVPSSGAGQVRLTLWSDVTGTLVADGAPLDVTLFRNQWVRMTFAGTAGQNLGVDVSGLVAFNSGAVNVFRPDGGNQNGVNFGAAGVGMRLGTLGQAGVYTVVVAPTSGLAGSLKVTLWSDVMDILTVGTPYVLQIGYRNQLGRNRFNGTSGQNLGVELSGVSLPANSSLSVLRPDGAAISNAGFGTSGLIVNLPTLTVTGEYTVAITPAGSATGEVTIRVFNR